MLRRLLVAALFGFFASIRPVMVNATSDEKAVTLWSVVATISVPSDIYVSTIKTSDVCLCFETYAFYSAAHNAAVLTAAYDALDGDIGFLSAKEFAASKPITINGLAALQVDDPPYTRIQIKLPLAKDCPSSGHEFALLVFAQGDELARHLAGTFKAKNPYPCISDRPIP